MIKLDYTRQFEKVENRTSKEAGRMKKILLKTLKYCHEIIFTII